MQKILFSAFMELEISDEKFFCHIQINSFR